MASPEAGDDRLTRGPIDQPALEDEDGARDQDLAPHSSAFRAQHIVLIGAGGEHVDQVTSSSAKLHPSQTQTQTQHETSDEASTTPHAEPTEAHDCPDAVFLQRPRSSREELGTGFKFGKQQKAPLDMKRRRGTNAQTLESAAPRETPMRGSANRQGKLSQPIQRMYAANKPTEHSIPEQQSQRSLPEDSTPVQKKARTIIGGNKSDQQENVGGLRSQPVESHSLFQGAQKVDRYVSHRL